MRRVLCKVERTGVMCRLFANASTLFSSPCILPHFHKIDVYFRLIFYVLKKIHYAVYVSSLIVFDKNAQINTNVDILTFLRKKKIIKRNNY